MQPSSPSPSSPSPSPLAIPSSSHQHNDRRLPSSLTTSIQTGESSNHTFVLGYTLHPKRAYETNKFGVKGGDYKIPLKIANAHKYQELIN